MFNVKKKLVTGVLALLLGGLTACDSDSPTWRAPVHISQGESGIIYLLKLFGDDAGNFTMNWLISEDLSDTYLQTKVNQDGVLSQPDTLDPALGFHELASDINTDGTAFRLGYILPHSVGIIQESPNGERKEMKIVDNTLGAISQAYIKVGSQGNAMAVWNKQNKIYQAHYIQGKGWQSTSVIKMPELGNFQIATLRANPAGQGYFFWAEGSGDKINLHAKAFDMDTGWSDSYATIATNIPLGNYVIEGDVDNSGNAVVVWFQFSGTGRKIWTAAHRGGVWEEPMVMDSKDDVRASGPKVVIDENGTALLTWARYYETGSELVARSLDLLSGWQPETILFTSNYSGTVPFSVGHDYKGTFHLAYTEKEGDHENKLFLRKFKPGQNWSEAETLLTVSETKVRDPYFAASRSGTLTLAWVQGPGNDAEIWGMQFR